MNISRRQTGELNSIITIELNPEDYQPKVNETIKAYRKTASLPGFRPGHVPADIIRKKFGREVLVEELNKILGRELVNYLAENKIDVLGTPLPVQSPEELVLEEGRKFSFDYEVGLAPNIEVRMPADKLPYYKIRVDDKMVDDDINDLRRKYGKFSNPEAAEETSILYGEFTELNEQGEILEGGNKTTTTLSLEMIRDDAERKKFIGVRKGETVRFNPVAAYKNETEVAATLRVDKTAKALHSDYQFTVRTVNKIEKAEMNQEFFDKAFGEGAVASEDEFRTKIREGIISYFSRDSDRRLQKDLRIKFLEANNFLLPADFLKRMLKARQEKPLTEEEFEHEFFHVIEDLKWNLINEKIAADQSVVVSGEEVRDMARIMISQQFAQYGMAPPEDEQLQEYINGYLEKDDSYERLERSLRSQKVFDYLKKNVALNEMELPYSEFLEKMQEKTKHELEHHQA
jgi:trigger factor